MAERRMFTKKITDSDAFTGLPPTTQALYFHLCMNADDDGFNNKIRQAMFNAHADLNDYNLLIQHRFIIPFEDKGVIVIKHWRLHNIIRNDRYHRTEYVEEKARLILKENGVYTESDNQVTTMCQPSDNQMETEVRLGKDSIGKDSIDKGSIDNIPPYIPPKGKEPKKQTAAELRKVFNSLVEESDLSDALKIKMYEWLDYKSQIKNQYKSPDGFSKLLTQVSKKALEFTDTEVIRVMDDTMAAGYKGIVWDWLSKQKQNTNTGSAYIDAIHNRLDVVDKWLKEGD